MPSPVHALLAARLSYMLQSWSNQLFVYSELDITAGNNKTPAPENEEVGTGEGLEASVMQYLTYILSKEIARNREGECLSEKYVYNKALILWKYAKDHLWSANLNCVKNRKTWCPWCAVDNRRSRTIEDMKKFAEKKRVFALQIPLNKYNNLPEVETPQRSYNSILTLPNS
ncbi:hypothetical protein GLOIN_2v1483130 [Rhizophagus irregularis DAOM 181602=DAOM 197198]|uniref:Uncharacterized protein n=1 Tax=Rhizophagus irregularis (strain DAOM 181602 / DAOM 197198 / MUCL 43194) TaxID=747089 RepID=A0A2P4PJ75_RHIID|nr:hypothetical protein GLOIN_2v1483130 [Rhizophagus irregularis DAOM 181602=DAOM 197198]POG65445.1 hypothetical protein GLOIN_2v1483130 [Rhizophagus irregularis DAOM 181602=DAOM 197198]|eukprot:XP_025172311.1 hypothetical protein GLOIN_2v1483130 [Rhizophagus irregularis DAOM 181602=DAOM 197198]